jgi:hypothetical protein
MAAQGWRHREMKTLGDIAHELIDRARHDRRVFKNHLFGLRRLLAADANHVAHLGPENPRRKVSLPRIKFLEKENCCYGRRSYQETD